MKNIAVLKERMLKIAEEIKKIEARKQLTAGKITLSIFTKPDDLIDAEKMAEFKIKIAEALR